MGGMHLEYIIPFYFVFLGLTADIYIFLYLSFFFLILYLFSCVLLLVMFSYLASEAGAWRVRGMFVVYEAKNRMGGGVYSVFNVKVGDVVVLRLSLRRVMWSMYWGYG
jgi:hypothetical protein